jgi:hypothetical protein
VRGDPLPITLPDRSAPALHWSWSFAKFGTGSPKSGIGKFNGKLVKNNSPSGEIVVACVAPQGGTTEAAVRKRIALSGVVAFALIGVAFALDAFRPISLSQQAASSDPKGHERSCREGRMDFTELPRRNFLGLY